MTVDPEKVAAKLRQLEARNAELTAKADARERENRELRGLPKELKAAKELIGELRDAAAESEKRAQAAEVRARGFESEVATLEARVAKLQSVVDKIAERDAADRELESLLGSR